MFEGWPPPVLDPAGPYATSVSLLSWILFCMAAAVLAIVLAALYVALFGRPAMQAKIGGKTAIWIGGVAFPLVVLTALLIYGLSLTRHLSDPIRGDELRVGGTGGMWWWRVAFLDGPGRGVIHTAKALQIPPARPGVRELHSAPC